VTPSCAWSFFASRSSGSRSLTSTTFEYEHTFCQDRARVPFWYQRPG
jgi:hypothetical protein